MTSAITVEVMAARNEQEPYFDYEAIITDPADREWAESAAGFITFGLGQAVVKVLEAGNLLAEAKRRLPHGQYLPWVEQACGLKPSYAARLIKVAELVNVEHVPHLGGCTDVGTLFILSADTTTEEVREWFMERCAAGAPPSRKEVQDRKRQFNGQRIVRPAETIAISLLRKGIDELERMRQALALADRAAIVTADQVMAEQRLRQLPKGSVIHGADADFHRMKDGTWVRLPHEGMVDVLPMQVEQLPEPLPKKQQTLIPEPQASPLREGVVLTRTEAAELLGINPGSFSTTVSRAKRAGQHAVIKGRRVETVSRGLFRVV